MNFFCVILSPVTKGRAFVTEVFFCKRKSIFYPIICKSLTGYSNCMRQDIDLCSHFVRQSSYPPFGGTGMVETFDFFHAARIVISLISVL